MPLHVAAVGADRRRRVSAVPLKAPAEQVAEQAEPAPPLALFRIQKAAEQANALAPLTLYRCSAVPLRNHTNT